MEEGSSDRAPVGLHLQGANCLPPMARESKHPRSQSPIRAWGAAHRDTLLKLRLRPTLDGAGNNVFFVLLTWMGYGGWGWRERERERARTVFCPPW